MRISDWSSDVCSSDLFGDIFSDLFNGGQRRRGSPFGQRPQRRGADVAYRLQVPFEEAAALKPQRVTLSNGKTIDLKLPPGIESGRQMRLSGQGEAGPGGNGDALVTIEIAPHRFFKRDGDDVRLDRSEEHTSELQSLMRISYAVFCLK